MRRLRSILPWIIIGLLCVPAVPIVQWLVSAQAALHQPLPPPRWELTSKIPVIQNDLGSANIGTPPPEIVSPAPPGIISRDRAFLISTRLAAEWNDSGYSYGSGPTLVRAAFPDGVRRLAWRRIVVTNMVNVMEGLATAIYLDAYTGAPLALIRDIPVEEPSFTTLSFDIGPVMLALDLWGPPVLLVGYLVLAGAGALVVLMVRRVRQAAKRRV